MQGEGRLISEIISDFEIISDAHNQGDVHWYQFIFSNMLHKALQIHTILMGNLENW